MDKSIAVIISLSLIGIILSAGFIGKSRERKAVHAAFCEHNKAEAKPGGCLTEDKQWIALPVWMENK